MDILLPEAMMRFVEEQVVAGEYASASEYIAWLVRADQKRCAKEQLGQVLVSAIGDGEVTPEVAEEIEARMRARVGR